MDAARYGRIRELFLAAEELPPDQQHEYLKSQTEHDQSLFDEVVSLLREHDPESARREGNQPAVALRAAVQRAGQSHSAVIPRRTDLVPHADGSSRSNRLDPIKQAPSKTHPSSALLWEHQTRRSRRRNSKWLWLAALLPTALIGWFTYHQVNQTMEQSVRDELRGIADSVSHASRRFLVDKSRLVSSWSRQPGIQSAIVELTQIAAEDPAALATRGAPQAERIESQLRQLSNVDAIKFVVWSDGYRTLATSDERLAKLGSPVAPQHAEMLSRVMSGQTVVFGPERIDPVSTKPPVPNPPAMAVVVPIDDGQGRIVAALLIGGIGMFDEFSRMYFDVANAGNLDAYAVNESGVMVTESPRAATLASMMKLDATVEEIAAKLRVADPGVELTPENIGRARRSARPLTASAASATAGQSDVRIDPYRNYAGQKVVGAWRWNSDSNLGIIVERQSDAAFATVRIVRSGFLLLGTLLFITASMAAAFLARASTAERAAVHPLSRYDVIRELGSGGMGVVYLARHRQLGRDTALKVMIGGRRHKQDRLRFDREARLAASLSSPHSVMIYDYGRSEDGESYCVMEFLRGLTLQEVVQRSGPQPVGRVLFILSQVCEALTEAHDLNLLHRDIKPQNIMLSLDQAVGDWAVLFDYGLAKPLEPAVDVYQTSEAHWSGTPMYMAPERFRQPNSMDRRSDIYSLGCVAYYLLSGHPPFVEQEAESLFALILSQQPTSLEQRLDAPLPQQVSDLVNRCMAKSPDDRFASVADLSAAIDKVRGQHPWTLEEAKSWWDRYGRPGSA
jgi:tRNA A-37 threonylcarbamoyl transferase component Bud32